MPVVRVIWDIVYRPSSSTYASWDQCFSLLTQQQPVGTVTVFKTTLTPLKFLTQRKTVLSVVAELP